MITPLNSRIRRTARFCAKPTTHASQRACFFNLFEGVLFGVVFYLLRDSIFGRRNGWLTAWLTLVIVGILCTFGPAPGSIEGFIYTKLPAAGHVGGMIEVMAQSLLLAILTVNWVNRPNTKWLTWTLLVLFTVALLLPTVGLIVAVSG